MVRQPGARIKQALQERALPRSSSGLPQVLSTAVISRRAARPRRPDDGNLQGLPVARPQERQHDDDLRPPCPAGRRDQRAV